MKQSQYRLRMLNGCDSRFLVLRFVYVSDTTWAYEDPIPNGTLSGGFEAVSFQVIGSDQGLTRENNNTEHNYIVVEPGMYVLFCSISRVKVAFSHSPLSSSPN